MTTATTGVESELGSCSTIGQRDRCERVSDQRSNMRATARGRKKWEGFRKSGGEICEICPICRLHRVRAPSSRVSGPEKFTVNFAARLTSHTLRPQNGRFAPLYTTFPHFTPGSLSRYPLLSHVQYWDNAHGCADGLLRASLIALSPRRGARPPHPLQNPRGLPRWDNHISEGVAKRRTATRKLLELSMVRSL
jgi:hypothetical protein